MAKTPRLVLSRSAWSSIVRWSAEAIIEQWGFLLGTRSGKGLIVGKATKVQGGKRTPHSIKIDYAAALAEELALRKKYPAMPPVGAWHSHPWGTDLIDALAIQLSTEDKRSVQDGALEVVVAVHDDIMQQHRFTLRDDLLVRRWKGKTCRVEAWVRMGRRFLPLDIEAK